MGVTVGCYYPGVTGNINNRCENDCHKQKLQQPKPKQTNKKTKKRRKEGRKGVSSEPIVSYPGVSITV